MFAIMEREVFYKDQYDQSLSQKSEINSSLSTPIGILTALMAGLYYATTNFEYGDNLYLTIGFTVISFVSFVLLCFSIFRLIRAFSDFQNGLDYAFINTADILDDYYKNLVSFYASQTGTTPAQAEQRALKDFGAYLIGELVRNTGINQLNNREKIRQRFQCHQYMIYALISLGLLIFPFGIDFGMNKGKDKVQKVKIDSVIPQ
jgi:hypothetical protein